MSFTVELGVAQRRLQHVHPRLQGLQGVRLLHTRVMALSEIPPQMANFQTLFLKDLLLLSGLFLYTLHTAIL